MYEIEMQEMSQDFFHCWQAAAMHLDGQVDGGITTWLRGHPYPPFLEHLSFRLGNQLFFVRIEDTAGKVKGPGSLRGLATVAASSNGRACVMPMKKSLRDGWVADAPGWGLLDAQSRRPIDPLALITEENIPMSRWEVHDMAVQVVRGHLEGQGYELMSWQGNPEVDPSIWFIGESKRPEWVVVRAAAFPAEKIARPANWQDIVRNCARMSTTGHFASIVVINAEQDHESQNAPALPLWRGHGMHIQFTGLE